jgi:hypothetical protein
VATISRPVYAVHLRFDGAGALPRARALTRRWLAGRFGGWPTGLDSEAGVWVPADGHRLSFRSAVIEGERFWEASWEYPHQDPTLRWVLVVLIGSDLTEAFAQVRLGLAPAAGPGRLSDPVGYDLARPHIVHSLVSQLEVVDAGRVLTPGPWRIDDEAGVYQLARVLADPDRRLPVLVCSRRPGAPEPDAPAGSLADTCIGLAHVVDLVDPELTYVLTDVVGRSHSVYSGAMRLFWAGWSPTDPPHPLWRPDEMRDRFGSFADAVRRRLYTVASFRTVEPTLVGRLERAGRRQRMAALRTEAAAQESEARDLLEFWESDLGALEEARLEVELLAEEVERLRGDNEALRAGLGAAWRHRPEVPQPEPLPHHDTVGDAVAAAARDLGHLEFHPRAFESAAECPYRWPDRLYKDLAALDDLVGGWKETGRLEGGWLGAAREAGINWADDVSFTARTHYRQDYQITLADGTRVLLGPHLKRGAATGPEGYYRCYLYIDEDTRRVIVGHIGRHLRDRTNAA